MDEFDYNVNLSGLEGSDTLLIDYNMEQDLKLPCEFAVSIASSHLNKFMALMYRNLFMVWHQELLVSNQLLIF